MSKHTIIIGLGITGLSCARFFLTRGYDIRVVDTRENPPELSTLHREFPNTPVHLGELPLDWLLTAEQIIVSPGVSLAHPALQEAAAKGIKIRGDIDVFTEFAKAPIVGITGSNGKSTVTSWLGHMGAVAGLNWQVCGNIGVPVLDVLEQGTPDMYVMELSSFQLETTHHLPLRAATILNITPDHLDRYAGMLEYTAAKQRIYQNCEVGVFYRAQIETRPSYAVSELISFDLDTPDAGNYGVINAHLALGDQLLMPINELSLPGSHNVLNALATTALARAAGLSWEAIGQSLRTFTGLPHRCQLVIEHAGVRWINDSKGTNVGATLAAMEGLAANTSGKLILILGGDGKGADFSPLIEPLQRYARAAVLLGQDAPKLQHTLRDALPLYRVSDLSEAINQAAKLVQARDVVLLSPACSSLDMFANYGARGDEFARLVKAMVAL